jgi:nicotinamidase-related amidase
VVLVIDMLNDHLTPGRPIEIPRARAIVPAVQARLAEARARAIPVIYVCDAHPPDDEDFRDWPPHNVEGTAGAEVWPDLAPEPGDHVVRKRTYSAFTGTDLAPLLDRLGADELVLTGCATEVQLAATAMEALQRGFVVTIPPDCQAGTSELAEQVAMLTLSAMPPFEPRYLRR